MLFTILLAITMKRNLLSLLALIPLILFSQSNKNLKTISGFISFENKPLSNVNIFVKDTITSAFSNSKGFYEIKAEEGDYLRFEYIGLQNTQILVEDVTTTLNLEMRNIKLIPKSISNNSIKLSGGSVGSSISNFKMLLIKGKDLNQNAETLTQAILEKAPFLRAVANDYGENILYVRGKELDGHVMWIIDEILFDIPFPVYVSEVKTVAILNSDTGGCVIKLETNVEYSKLRGINFNNYYFTDNDFYTFDAISYKKQKRFKPKYLNDFKRISFAEKALEVYEKQYSLYKNDTNYHLTLINYFQKNYKSKESVLKTLSDYENFAVNNPEDLKVVAYKYQELNEYNKALVTYKRIANLRPNHRQSSRDIANAYLDLKDYRMASLMHKYYLKQSANIIENNDSGDIISSEIISNYNKESDDSYQKIKLADAKKITESDIRLVFEWNTTEAEFIIEFVNPKNQLFKLVNSLEKNYDLIIDQKTKGYTSKEVIIQELKAGNWLVNFTYLGNKQYKPTVLKLTTYYNWGKPNESKKINVFEFTMQNRKMKLLKLNRKSL